MEVSTDDQTVELKDIHKLLESNCIPEARSKIEQSLLFINAYNESSELNDDLSSILDDLRSCEEKLNSLKSKLVPPEERANGHKL